MVPGGPDPEVGVVVVALYDGSVWQSDDAAVSWRAVGQVPFGDADHLEDAVLDASGRLYVAGKRSGAANEWVYRTTGPVVTAAVTTEAEPVGGPVVVGPEGGTFSFTVTLRNQTTQPLAFEAWSEAEGPVSVSPVVGPRTVVLPVGGALTRTLTQRVPAVAPPGVYTYTVNAGDFPGLVVSADSFTVTKQVGASLAADADDDWTVSGWDDAAAEAEAAESSLSVSPNPFRGAATVMISLGSPSPVEAVVYDVLGRTVAVLADGHFEAGRHAVVFDGAQLPAGTYVVRLVAGGEVLTRRVTVLR